MSDRAVALFDIDGTLADDRWRRHLINMAETDPDERYRRYHLAAPADRPANLETVYEELRKGKDIRFITTRPIAYYGQTMGWLQNVFPDIINIRIHMRPTNDHRTSPEIKLEQVVGLSEEYDDIVVFEDRPDVIKALQTASPVTTVELSVGPPYDPNPRNPLGLEEKRPYGQMQADEILLQGAKTYAERNAVYGNNYHTFGPVLEQMFPDGLMLRTADDWNRLGVFVQMMGKLTRFSNSGLEHVDSVHDLMVYSAMMEELLDGR